MTLCIAAVTRYEDVPCLVLCADRRVENFYHGADIGFKVSLLDGSWSALLAGSVSNAKALIDMYSTLSLHNTDNMGRSQVLEILRVPPVNRKAAVIQEYTRTRYALSYEEFMSKGAKKQIPPDLFHASMLEISQLTLDCELILAGLCSSGPLLIRVDTNGVVHSEDNFTAIGSGATMAEAMLYHRAQHETTPFAQTIYHVYEAKVFSEKATGVGKATSLLAMCYPRGIATLLEKSEEGIRDLFTRFGPQPTKDLDPAVLDDKLKWVQSES